MKRKILYIVAFLVIIFLGVAGFKIIANRHFKIVNTTPPLNNFPTSSDTIEIFFNRVLGENTKEQITLSNNLLSDVAFKDKSIVVRFKTLPPEGELTLGLNGIKSEKDELLTETLTINVKYIDLSKLPGNQKKSQTEQSDSFESRYPLIKNLPLITDYYSVDYKYPSDQESRMPVTITMSFNADLDPNTGTVTARTRQEYINNIRKYRNEAITLLKDHGYTKDKYDLIFSEPELAEEFKDY